MAPSMTNWSADVAATAQPIVPLLGGVWGSETSQNITDQKNNWTAIQAARSDCINGILTGNVTFSTMTWTISGDVYSDGSHPNTAGYDLWETNTHAQVESFIAAQVALHG